MSWRWSEVVETKGIFIAEGSKRQRFLTGASVSQWFSLRFSQIRGSAARSGQRNLSKTSSNLWRGLAIARLAVS